MNKKFLTMSLVSLLSIAGLAGCGGNGKDTSSQDSFATWSSVDKFETIPEEVKNYSGSIDFAIYIEGQSGTYEDIGDPYKYTPDKIPFFEMARFIGAARAFKHIAPKCKINLLFCSISEYNDLIISYNQQKGHLPHLMWATDHVVEMVQEGYYADLSIYEDTEYYQSFNDYIMSRFNFGGFQGAIPIAAEPWGVFVNLDSLDSYGVVDTKDATAYSEWVDNFTWPEFLEACSKTNDSTHAGVSKIVDHTLSYSAPTIYDQFLKEGSVDLTNPVVEQLIDYEAQMTEYTAFEYDGDTNIGDNAKEQFDGTVYNWSGTKNFAEDEAYTFYTEAPWALTTISQWITEHEGVDTRVDYLPYPMVVDAQGNKSDAYVGIAVEGVGVGNLCPVGSDDKHHCYGPTAELEQEVAAYFAMFMSADYRSIKERAEIEFTFAGVPYKGSLTLPMVEKDFTFSWEEDVDITSELGDYYEGHSSNFDYQLAKFFDVYSTYLTSGEHLDVENYSNLTYGLTKILDSMYGEHVTCINFWNEPVNIPDGSKTKDIFANWQNRHKTYKLGSENYVSEVKAMLQDLENEINDDVETAWELIQECLDNFYEEGKYDVSDHSSRADY